MAFCKSCQAQIDWYKTSRGNWMPIDKDPSPEGNIFVDPVANLAFVVEKGSRAVLYVSHFVTCPQRREHRRRA